MDYYYKKIVTPPFLEAVEKTKTALAEEGFGVLTEIDVRATMKKKLDVEYENYIILGACNPPFAYEALCAEKDIGLLLPCNVIVYEDKGAVWVSAIVPSVAMAFVGNVALEHISAEIETKLINVVDSIL